MTTRLEELDRATGLIVEADRLIRDVLGDHNFVSHHITSVLDYLGEEMGEIESEEYFDEWDGATEQSPIGIKEVK